jgi:hypothetical protein
MSNIRQLLREIAQVPQISWVQDIDRRWWAIFSNGDRVYLAEPTKLHETFNRIRLGSLQKSVGLD